MKTDLDIRVVELLCSRLCHELVSPVGAINNGVELIEEMGADMADEAIGYAERNGRQKPGALSNNFARRFGYQVGFSARVARGLPALDLPLDVALGLIVLVLGIAGYKLLRRRNASAPPVINTAGAA